MTYKKPEIVSVANAVAVIQGSATGKPDCHADSHSNEHQTTTGAYQADE
jgi:hypothetical protein